MSLARPYLVDELCDTVAERYGGEKVTALGHSLGGFLSFMVSVSVGEMGGRLGLLGAWLTRSFLMGIRSSCFQAAVKRPELFNAVVMLDSPIMGPQRVGPCPLRRTSGTSEDGQ